MPSKSRVSGLSFGRVVAAVGFLSPPRSRHARRELQALIVGRSPSNLVDLLCGCVSSRQTHVQRKSLPLGSPSAIAEKCCDGKTNLHWKKGWALKVAQSNSSISCASSADVEKWCKGVDVHNIVLIFCVGVYPVAKHTSREHLYHWVHHPRWRRILTEAWQRALHHVSLMGVATRPPPRVFDGRGKSPRVCDGRGNAPSTTCVWSAHMCQWEKGWRGNAPSTT